MVIKVQMHDWSVKRGLIDQGNSADILYWDAFQVVQQKVTSDLSTYKKIKLFRNAKI